MSLHDFTVAVNARLDREIEEQDIRQARIAVLENTLLELDGEIAALEHDRITYLARLEILKAGGDWEADVRE